MFGYIKCYAPELKVRANEYYRAVYCGICRSLGKCTGCASRFTLNYDSVFGALIRIAVTGNAPEIEARRCVAHPLHKRPSAKRNEELDFAARTGVMLAYYKACDDVSDEKGSRRFRARMLRGFTRGMNRRAAKKLKDAETIIKDGLTELSAIEERREPSVDIPADCFGDLMGKLLSYGIDGAGGKIAFEAGRRLGRWLYIIDAADDLEKDAAMGRYNPFILLWDDGPLDETRKDEILGALALELSGLEAAVDLIDATEDTRDALELIYNAVRLGMPRETERVLNITKGKSKE